MALSNINKYKGNPNIVDKIADNNLEEFKKLEARLNEMKDSEKMISNITSMKNKLNRLVEYDVLKENDAIYKVLSGTLDEAIKIQIKPDKSVEDIYNAYHAYNDFNNTYKIMGGDNCV